MTRLLLVGALAIIATIIWAGGYGIFKDEVERRETPRTPTPVAQRTVDSPMPV
jgi:hypothetical protein